MLGFSMWMLRVAFKVVLFRFFSTSSMCRNLFDNACPQVDKSNKINLIKIAKTITVFVMTLHYRYVTS